MSQLLKSLGLLSVCLFLACISLSAQQAPKRLILKDGSYQTATRWEIKGDRVRFYSAERYAWEELPTLLVDWPATERFNRELESDRAAGAIKLNKQADADEPPEKPELPPVAPGLRLPDDGGVFLLDTFKNQPELVEMQQNGGELNHHTGRNILRAAINPLALSSKQTIEVQGSHAAVQAHVSQPVFYLYLQLDAGATSPPVPIDDKKVPAPAVQPPPPAERYRIVRMQSAKDKRVVGDLSVGVTGKISHKENAIKSSSSKFGDWIKITADEPLPQGEYAIIELLEKGQINFYVWDFGVDASAPENANAQSARPAPSGNAAQPVLEKRPK
jgi:hypothetical protein